MDDKKKHFYEILSKIVLNKNSSTMDLKKYNTLVQLVHEVKKGAKSVRNKTWLLKHYDLLAVGGQAYLIFPIKNSQILYYVPKECLYDVLSDIHQSTGHVGRDRMLKKAQQKYKNITRLQIQVFLNICEPCLRKQKIRKKIRRKKEEDLEKISIRTISETEDPITANVGDIKKCNVCKQEIDNDICGCCKLEKKSQALEGHIEILENQAKRMKLISDASLPEAETSTTIALEVPIVDKGREVVRTPINISNNSFQLATKDSIIEGLNSSIEFNTHPDIIVPKDMPHLEHLIKTTRSIGANEGFIRCFCKKNCLSNKCSCFKYKKFCTSKCHSNLLYCCNK